MNVKPFYIISYKSDHMSLPLHRDGDTNTGCKVAVVIGPNGSRKSTVVANLVDELDWMHSLLSLPIDRVTLPRAAKQTRGAIEYRAGKHIYRVERKGMELKAFRDGEPSGLKNVPFPSRVLAMAHLPADKFRFSRNEEAGFYWYLGLRQATNLSTTGALEAKVISSLLTGLNSREYRRALSEWLKVLEIGGEIQIELRNLRREAFQIQTFSDFNRVSGRSNFGPVEESLKRSTSRRLAAITEQGIAGFFLRLAALETQFLPAAEKLKTKSRVNLRVPLGALSDDLNAENGVIWEAGIELIRKYRIADEVRLIVRKKQNWTSFADLSSGERQIVGSVTQLFEYATDGCVIAIDEPEVSLHPSWQIRYIPTLLRALSHLKSAHIIITTHSHFLVSDVDEETSSLVVADSNNQDRWKFNFFDGPVHGRTPENILYRVFGVGSGSNFYVEQDLAKALLMISGTQELDVPELRRIRARLDRIATEDNPALQEILRTLDGRLPDESNA